MTKKFIVKATFLSFVFAVSTAVMSATIKANPVTVQPEATVPEITVIYPSNDNDDKEDTSSENIIYEEYIETPDVKGSARRDIDILALSYSETEEVKGIEDGVYPTCPFLDAVDSDRVIWYTGNMKLCSNEISSTEYEWTQEDLDWMAKIIHCEICDEGAEARRAVGTVIMNRIEWKACPDTVLGVISQKNQFSPWGSGKIFDAEPCDYCKEAAYDVLVNDYRSFPREVRYFESIEDGYFDNVLTYAYFKESGFNTWFGFNPDDVNEPNI